MYFEQYEYSICGAYLPAIINGDYSGLDDDEEKTLNSFLHYVFEAHGAGHWSVDSEESSFQECEVSDLMADCYDCTYNASRLDIDEITAIENKPDKQS